MICNSFKAKYHQPDSINQESITFIQNLLYTLNYTIMKNTMLKLLSVIFLFAGVSCSQSEEASVESENNTAAETDTVTVSDEVPESLKQH